MVPLLARALPCVQARLVYKPALSIRQATRYAQQHGALSVSSSATPSLLQRPAARAATSYKVVCSAAVQFRSRSSPMADAAAKPAVADAKLAALRAEMAKADGGKGVEAYIVPTEDPHMSEYPPDCFKRREYISNFTGSAGTVVVTKDKALLWTDGRYFLQAQQELGSEWTLMRAGTGNCPEIGDWLAEVLPTGARIGVDPFCHTVENFNSLQGKLEAGGKVLVPLLADGNLVDRAWGSSRPAIPITPVRVHDVKWAGQEWSAKLDEMRGKMRSSGADVLVVTTLDEVAWLFNLRGSDVDYNPVFVSYAMVTMNDATLYTNPAKVPAEVADRFKAGGVAVKAYDQMVADVKAKAATGASLWMDNSKVSYALYQAAQEASSSGPRGSRGKKRAANGAPVADNGTAGSVKVVDQPSPIVAAKAIKNAAELEGMKEAHLRDAVAICDFLAWLEKEIASGKVLTEVDIDLQLTGRRKQQQGFIEPSFPTIAGANSNGAVIHYRAKEETAKSVDSSTLLLIDSGGQYDCGTTDITRTLHLGTPTAHQKQCYTRVLQGHIALDKVIFPEGTPGSAIDALARLALWQAGLNYRHGTGHGVGAALNVHEGPQSISTRYWITTPLQAGMICSNEPGYYEDGAFGVRIENLAIVEEADTQFRFGGTTFFKFTPLTLVPIETKMMDTELMTPQEVAWLDGYHAKVWEAVSPRLSGKPGALDWLKRSTRPLHEQQA